MNIAFLSNLNYLAVAIAGFAYFVLGSLWYSPVLFSAPWLEELKKHNVLFKTPTTKDLICKMILSLMANLRYRTQHIKNSESLC